MKKNIVWLRRDLRLDDNTALNAALATGTPLIVIFIFDTDILSELPKNDSRVSFIYAVLKEINAFLVQKGSGLLCLQGKPNALWAQLIGQYDIEAVYFNKDYEPYAIERDTKVKDLLQKKSIACHSFKDQVVFEEGEILKDNGKPYTVFTPYKNKWLQHYTSRKAKGIKEADFKNLSPIKIDFPTLASLGFEGSSIQPENYDPEVVTNYASTRDFPIEKTSRLGVHLRFGTISIRKVINGLNVKDSTFLNELIWREFFMQILFHFPFVVHENFKPQYMGIRWRNNEEEFDLWCKGETGYALVDAGMRELNATGFMHNRVRMITAGFLCKHLLIDWRWGEAYFAQKLMDYELASNNGNWQWAAGTGCDAAPYFRIFNPETQLLKFDKDLLYVKKWVPEYGTTKYSKPIVDHVLARERALSVYKAGIGL
jgi:deoxyribodipyrimidine photo-lyase